MATAERFVGSDVVGRHLDGAVLPSGEAWRVANDPVGHAALVRRVTALTPTLIVLEASGGYEAAAATALVAAGLAVAMVNLRQARDFARVIGHLAKTDALDAALLRLVGMRSGTSPARRP